MKTWDAFFRDVMPMVRGCPEPMAEHALLRAAQRFLRQTRTWMVDLQPVQTIPGLIDYDIELETNSELVRLEGAMLDGRPIDVTVEEAVAPNYRALPTGMQECIFTVDQKTLIVLPARLEAHQLRVKASLTLSERALGVEDFIFDQHVRKIALGAVADLMQQPGMPYTAAAQGMLLDKQFQVAMNTIAHNRSRGFSSARPRRQVNTF